MRYTVTTEDERTLYVGTCREAAKRIHRAVDGSRWYADGVLLATRIGPIDSMRTEIRRRRRLGIDTEHVAWTEVAA